MGAVATIEFRDATGDAWAACYPGTDEAVGAAIYFACLEYRWGGSDDAALDALARFYDHSVANGSDEPAGAWFPLGAGVAAFEAALAACRPGETSHLVAPWRDAGVPEPAHSQPAADALAALRQVRSALDDAAGRGAREFKLVVYD